MFYTLRDMAAMLLFGRTYNKYTTIDIACDQDRKYHINSPGTFDQFKVRELVMELDTKLGQLEPAQYRRLYVCNNSIGMAYRATVNPTDRAIVIDQMWRNKNLNKLHCTDIFYDGEMSRQIWGNINRILVKDPKVLLSRRSLMRRGTAITGDTYIIRPQTAQ